MKKSQLKQLIKEQVIKIYEENENHRPSKEEQKQWIAGRKQKRQELDNILMKSGVHGFKRK